MRRQRDKPDMDELPDGYRGETELPDLEEFYRLSDVDVSVDSLTLILP